MSSNVRSSFSAIGSGTSRAGVVVGYTPEDTMKSFLFDQNNRHCLNINQDDVSIFQLPQSEIEKALEFLSSDSETESSSITKITIKNASSITDNSHAKHQKYPSTNKSNTNTDWNGTDNSDADCTSADLSNDFAEAATDSQDMKLSIAHCNKPFEQIVEESLKMELPTKSHKAHPKSDPGSKPKFSFLKKNAGRAAWSSNIRLGARLPDNTAKRRSRSNDRDSVKHTQETNSNHQPVKRNKSMTSAIRNSDVNNGTKSEKPGKPIQKSVHFAASCRVDSLKDLKIEEPVHRAPIHQKVAEIEDRNIMNENQDLDQDLVEFELLEQIANVSINSSIASSIARYDEETLRQKIYKYKSMPPPISYSQNNYFDYQNNSANEILQSTTIIDRINQPLSMCEEQTETGVGLTNCDTEIDTDSDEESQNTSNNTTTLSEFHEPPINKASTQHKSQALMRKISKQNERYKNKDALNTDWIEDNPFPLGEASVNPIDKESQKISLNLPKVDWTFADPFHESGSSSDDDDGGDKTSKSNTAKDNQFALYPTINIDKFQSNPNDNINIQSAKLKQWVQLLESEVKRFKSENEEIEKLKKEKEDGLKRLEEEMKAFKKHKEDETKKFEEYKQTETKKLKKERKVFDEYQEAMKNMPNKKDRQEIENLKAEIEELKEELSNKENRWQAANTRLKQKIETIETENAELHSRIHLLEQKRLQLQAQLVSNTNQKPKSEPVAAKPKQTVTSVSQAVSMKHSNIPIGSKDDNNNNRSITNSSKTNPTQAQKRSIPRPSNTISKIQKSLKNHPNPFNSENGIVDIRGSAASDYYTGEEESGSIDLKSNRVNTHCSDIDFATPMVQSLSRGLRIDRSTDVLKDEVHHPDGIIERIYMSGCVDVVYPNSSLKQISADNKSIVVHLYNGDIKQIVPDGRVIYFYAQDESTQTTYPNGKEEIVYKNGHRETLHPNGIREISFPDKSVKIIHPDAREETFLPNGLVIRINGAGDKEIILPNGQKEIHTKGIKKRIYPDGTTKTVYPDGRQETFYASGRMRVKDKSGNLILDQYLTKTTSLTSSD